MAKALASSAISHWNQLIENLKTSPKDFYVSVERAVRNRKPPEIAISRVDWKESGVLSAEREYLRVSRGKYIFDICGAPFGEGFFVSWWLGEPRPSPVGPTVVAFAAFFFVFLLITSKFGFFGGLLYTFLALTAFMVFLGASLGEKEAMYLFVIPWIGPLFERTFFPPTYYRIDTALMFQQTVHAAVMEVVDELTKAQGIRSLTELERKPVLREFYKR
jgi:hypothetical protein